MAGGILGRFNDVSFLIFFYLANYPFFRYASSSYATKHPMVPEGTRFDDVVVDYYYNKKFEKTYEEEDGSRYLEPEKQIDDGQDKEEDIKKLTREQVRYTLFIL